MHFDNVCLESLGYTLPEQVCTSSQIEDMLAPLYQRLRLPEGRLELMSGIRERRFWEPGALPSSKSIQSARHAIECSGVAREQIGALVHTSVCRDHLEPATACRVHHALELPAECMIYDLSNACLGFLNGLVQVAGMIELGQIRAGVVVGAEGGRQLVETTIARLNEDHTLSRAKLKLAVASLTIGSASVAAVLTDRELSQTQNRLRGGIARAFTDHHELCRSGQDEAVAEGMSPLMQTDSEVMMHRGIEVARESFQDFLGSAGWDAGRIDKTVCHQVGKSHRKLMLEALGLDAARDFATLEVLGNTGSAALPISAALAAEEGFLQADDHVALLGIGSGINVLMLALDWQPCPVQGDRAGLPRLWKPAEEQAPVGPAVPADSHRNS